jgi:hypothetical protein
MALTLFETTYLTDPSVYIAEDSTWSETSFEEQERALVNATRLLDTMLWAGSAVAATQPLAWPRTEFSYYDPVLNLDVTVPEGTVPTRLEKAIARLALHLLKYPAVEKGYEASFDSITVGPISITNSNAASDPGRVPTIPYEVTKLVAPLTRDGYTANSWWRAN